MLIVSDAYPRSTILLEDSLEQTSSLKNCPGHVQQSFGVLTQAARAMQSNTHYRSLNRVQTSLKKFE